MRQEFHVHLDLSVPARTLIFFMAAALLVIVTPELGSENVTLSTYYPAPSGVYNKMVTTSTTFLATSGGMVGIGTTVPAAALDVAGGLLHVMGAAGANVADQGAYLGWNALNGGGTGETDFINNQGAGSGGFAFFNYNNAATDFQVPLLIAGSGAVSIGNPNPTGMNDLGSSTPNVGLYLTGQNNTPTQSNNGYLYIDNINTQCAVASCTPNAAQTDWDCCGGGGEYVTYTPGVYVEGWSYQNRGGPPAIATTNCPLNKVGSSTSNCWSYTVQGQIPTGLNPTWYTLTQNNAPPDAVFCCPK